VLKEVHPNMSISKRAKDIARSFINDMFERSINEMNNLARHSNKKSSTVTSRDTETAYNLILQKDSDLAKFAAQEGKEAVNKYKASVAKDLEDQLEMAVVPDIDAHASVLADPVPNIPSPSSSPSSSSSSVSPFVNDGPGPSSVTMLSNSVSNLPSPSSSSSSPSVSPFVNDGPGPSSVTMVSNYIIMCT